MKIKKASEATEASPVITLAVTLILRWTRKVTIMFDFDVDIEFAVESGELAGDSGERQCCVWLNVRRQEVKLDVPGAKSYR